MKYDKCYHPMFWLAGSFWVWIAFCRDRFFLCVCVSFYSVPVSSAEGENLKQIESTASNIP